MTIFISTITLKYGLDFFFQLQLLFDPLEKEFYGILSNSKRLRTTVSNSERLWFYDPKTCWALMVKDLDDGFQLRHSDNQEFLWTIAIFSLQ